MGVGVWCVVWAWFVVWVWVAWCGCRGKKLGVKLMEALKRIGRQLGCYKVILDCSKHNVNFYTRCGFKQKEVQMVAYISGNEQPRPRL